MTSLFEIQAATRFELTPEGRIRREGPPDLGPAPRLWRAGELVLLREDVDGAAGLPWGDGVEGVTYRLPARRRTPAVDAVRSGTPEGAALVARLADEGMPPELASHAFLARESLWPPWCACLDGETVVSVAFAARLSPVGAEAGVVTAPSARGRGLASALVAEWALHPGLAGRELFYSTDATNRASRRVAGRLGLELLGETLEIP